MEFRPSNVAINYCKKLKLCVYNRRKTYSQLSMDVALIVVNAAHIFHVVKGASHDNLYVIKLCLISLSIFLEVAILILLGFKERYDINDERRQRLMSFLNDLCVWLIFFSVLVHVFVSVFVEDNHYPPYFGRYGNCSATRR